AEGLVAVADHQRAGRGRWGRTWEAPPGTGLLLSVLLRPRLDPADLHLLAVAVAMAALSTCVEVGVEPRLKWPNDLVVGDRKLAGILAESPDPSALVVGLGLNVSWSPPGATSLVAEGGHPPPPGDLVDGFLLALEPRLAALGSPEGRHETMTRYRALCATLGRTVSVELPGENVVGRAVDVDDSGRLLLDVDGASRTVTAGDVVHLRDH
ncbi:MAG TPA: biotin--[acetyl-CoA-carboxylase] ligase, partial [Acidimicrobiales bacterium]|nr:biotin--[acetyl-CoA-carboxylase] ligase [Acidimicrobiales bacterium]